MNMKWEIAKEPNKGSVEAVPSLIKYQNIFTDKELEKHGDIVAKKS